MTDETMSSDPAYLRREQAQPQPAPISTSGPIAWMRAHLFSGWLSSILAILFAALVIWTLPELVRFFFLDAIWSASDGAPCRVPGAGACWAFVERKMDYFRYGSYPIELHWRVDVILVLGAVLVAHLLWPSERKGTFGHIVFVLAVPILMFMLIPGPAAIGRDPARELAILGGAIALAAILDFGRVGKGPVALLFFVVYPILAVVLLSGSRWLGMPIVDTNLWGGIFVSLLVATIGIVMSLPFGVLLALGRRSNLPIVKFFSVLFIEFVRGVPFITVLFMANTMLPLFVPEYLTPDRLLRPLIGVAVFASAYMAEEIRGGLQAIPKGQYEGAMAMGLGYGQMMRLVVLPQALTLVIPGIVNIFIGLFKDTTLVAIVGVFDFLRTVDAAKADPVWAGPTIPATAYAFAAVFYFVFCFGMSRYSLMMERRLSAGRRH